MDYTIKFTDPTKTPFIVRQYTTNGPATPNTPTPLHPSAVAANTSLILMGKGMFDYGEPIQTGLVHMLEHFANTTSPVYPVQGQLWYDNSSTGALSVYTGVSWYPVVISGLFADNLDLGGFKIVNMADPTLSQDAVTKNYGDLTYVLKSGDTMTGNLVISATNHISASEAPTLGDHLTNKTYVDGTISSSISALSTIYVNVTGDVMSGQLYIDGTSGGSLVLDNSTFVMSTNSLLDITGTLNILGNSIFTGNVDITGTTTQTGNYTVVGTHLFNFGGNILQNIADPVLLFDAATKNYVDTTVAVVTGADGTLTSGILNDLTGDLTLTSTVSGDVIVSGVSPFTHTHVDNTIFHNGDQLHPDSRIRQTLPGVFAYPNVNYTEITNQFDKDLYALRSRNARSLVTITDDAIIRVTPSHGPETIIGVTTGINGTFTIAGDLTAIYDTGVSFSVFGNTGNGSGNADGTYFVLSSLYDTVNTIITVGFITLDATTNDGTILAVDGTWTVAGDRQSLYTGLVKFVVTGNTGGADGTYIASVNYYDTVNTHINVNTSNPIPVTATADGIIQALTISTGGVAYKVTANNLMVFDNGVKQYCSTRSYGQIVLNAVTEQSDTQLNNGIYTFNLAVDGNPADIITITVNETIYAITDVNLTNNTWTISGNHSVEFPRFFHINISDTLPGGQADGNYTVVQAIDSGPDTIITVVEIIPVGTTGAGNIRFQYTFSNLIADINSFITSTLNDNSICVFEDTNITFYSAVDGSTSLITITDIDLVSNLPDALTIINGSAGVDYSYKEIGLTNQGSSVIEFGTLPSVGNVFEFISLSK